MRKSTMILLSVACLLAVVIIFGFFGVGSDRSNDARTQTEDIKITVFHYMMLQSHLNGLDEIENEYQQLHPEYNITWNNVVYNQGTDYFQQLQIALASGEQPEIIMGNPGLYPDVVESGFAMDLSDNKALNSSSLSDADKNDASYNGRIYAFPIDFKTWGVFYNKTIYSQLGLEVPKTYSQLIKNCETISAAGYDPWIHVFGDSVYGDIEMRNYVWTRALENGDTDMFERLMDGSARIEDYPYFEEGLTMWGDRLLWMRDDAMTNNQTTALQLFAAGEAAMIYTGTWGIATLESMISGTDFEYGFFIEPIDDEGSARMNVQTNAVFMVNPNSKNSRVALDFLEYWVSNGMSWSEMTMMPLCSGVSAKNVPDTVKQIAEIKRSGDVSNYGSFTVPFSSKFTTDYRSCLNAFASSYFYGEAMSAAECIDLIQSRFDGNIENQYTER